MSDLSDLVGIFPTALRWNAEDGFLAISIFNAETGERELKEIELGRPATFALDLATRERGYGLIKIGVYDMKLTPVGAPPPTWPGDGEEYKPALGCWLWNPEFGELRLETNASIFRQAIENIWRQARFAPQAVEGLQPVIQFVDRVPIQIKSIGKSFLGPVIKTVGWVPREQVPGWAARTPTVAPPAALPVLSPPTSAEPAAKEPAEARRHKAERRATKPEFDDPLDGLLDDDVPRKKR
jgi:hypothetical protein